MDKVLFSQLLDGISAEDICQAIPRFEAGDAARFGKPKSRYLLFKGKNYPIRPLVAIAAHRQLGRLITPRDFSGAKDGECNKKLRSLGFEVIFKHGSVDHAEMDEEYIEGRERLSRHRRKERNRRAVQRKKEQVLAIQSKLLCEACNFDFAEVYGSLGERFAECHHRTPLAQLSEEHRIKLSELAIVCANCHRMLHRRPFHKVEELRAVILDRRARSKH